jgi:hypothetical protein
MQAQAGKHATEARRFSAQTLIVGAVLGVVLAMVVWIVALFWFQGESLPQITRAELEAASARWERNGPASYRAGIRITGRQPGVVSIEVRDGVVTAMQRDGVTPSQRRTWDYWTVPNQFEMIGQDFDSAEDPEGGFGAPAGSRAVFRGEFDPKYGYPRRYERVVLGTPLDAGWEVVEFERLEGTED